MAGSIPQPFIDDLLERVDIVDVIDSRVKLKKTGKNYSACCPFHDEKTPSFSVSPDKQFYYCFGCGASGNAIGFVMDYERLSFPETVESLAKVAGVEVPREQTKDPQKRAANEAKEKARKLLFSLMEQANDYYQEQLREHPKKSTPVNYLKNRGLSGQIAKEFGIGYAPAGWDNLIKTLATSNERQDLLLDGGMLIRNEEKNRLYDRFRERIMFPIRDSRGRVIGFGGRVLNDEKPKYLNSPETPIFFKGKELYGLYEARQAYRQLPRVLVVEGYMDVVALAQYGIRYGVATLGTACSEEHLRIAFKYTNEVVFCFDGDEAGRKAARRAMENSLAAMEDGRQIKFLYLPEGEDPDTLVRQVGEDKFTRLIEGASPLEQFLFEELGQTVDTQTMEGRARLCKMAAPMLDQLPRGVYRELMFNQLANRTQLSVDALMRLLEELPQEPPQSPTQTDTKQAVQQSVSTGSQTPASQHSHTSHSPDSINNEHSHSNQYSTHDYSYSDDNHYFETPSYNNESSSQAHTLSSDRLKNPQAQTGSSHQLAHQALSLLLFQPNAASSLNELHLDDLRHSNEKSVTMLVNLIDLLQQRPEFTRSQIIGHWQGTYGADDSNQLQKLADKAAIFYHANDLTHTDEKQSFNPQQELVDAIQLLTQQQQQRDCDNIIEQLNNKPSHEWSAAEKQLYLKAIAARAN
ncbi:DNA primase [Eionea flava]